MGIGHWELLLVAFVAVLLFGHRLPKVMGSLGEGMRNFRDAFSGQDKSSAAGDSTIHK